MDSLELLEPRDSEDSRVRMVSQVKTVTRVLPDQMVIQDRLDLLVLLARPDFLEIKVLKVQLELQERLDHLDHKDNQEM